MRGPKRDVIDVLEQDGAVRRVYAVRRFVPKEDEVKVLTRFDWRRMTDAFTKRQRRKARNIRLMGVQ